MVFKNLAKLLHSTFGLKFKIHLDSALSRYVPSNVVKIMCVII